MRDVDGVVGDGADLAEERERGLFTGEVHGPRGGAQDTGEGRVGVPQEAARLLVAERARHVPDPFLALDVLRFQAPREREARHVRLDDAL